MQKCKKCKCKFGYKDKLRSLFFSSPIICEGCGGKYYVRHSTRLIGACLNSLPILEVNRISSVLVRANINIYAVFGVYLIWVGIVILVMPLGAGFYLRDDGDLNC